MPSDGKIWNTKEPQSDLNEFEKLLLGYDYSFKKGDIIKGIVVDHDSSGVIVDIGSKTSAIVPYRELSNIPIDKPQDYLKIGEDKEFLIIKDEDDDGQFMLSLKRVSNANSWAKLEELKTSDTILECDVISTVKGGILVDVMGLRGFVPSSHLKVKPSESLIGQKLPLKILSIDAQKNNLIMSHRKVMSEQQAEQRKDVFEKLEVGVAIEGEVVRLADFGAFVDIGGIDGLLPLSQMSWKWVDHPSDILKVGDKITVEIIGIDHNKQRISLSLKTQQPDPWDEVAKIVKIGGKIPGRITRIKSFGAFIEVYPGVEALLPYKELAEFENEEGKKLQVGQEITTTVVRFIPEERRMSLSYTGQFYEEEHSEN